MVDFCNREIAARYGNSRFLCTESRHDFYSKFDRNPASEGRMSEDEFFDRYKNHFDLVLAFSIFTHFLEEDTRRYFAKIRRVLKANGVFWFTCFLIDEVSVHALETGLPVSGGRASSKTPRWETMWQSAR
jgi:cyclopropane fatty-acyl-phospholipid synthase-like methyltransferase